MLPKPEIFKPPFRQISKALTSIELGNVKIGKKLVELNASSLAGEVLDRVDDVG